MGRADAPELGHVVLGAEDDLRRDAALRENALGTVDVVEEGLERADPLLDAALDRAPVSGGDDARHQAKGENLLGAARVAVHGKGDALIQERALGEGLSARDCRGAL